MKIRPLSILLKIKHLSLKKTSDKPTKRLATRLKRVRISYSLMDIGQLVIGYWLLVISYWFVPITN